MFEEETAGLKGSTEKFKSQLCMPMQKGHLTTVAFCFEQCMNLAKCNTVEVENGLWIIIVIIIQCFL